MTADGGYGTLYGPNVAVDGTVTNGEGRIAGTEVLATAAARRRRRELAERRADGAGAGGLRPQAPVHRHRHLVGLAQRLRGHQHRQWGLKRSCAVAYTDKGTGAAPHDLMNDSVPLIDGTRAPPPRWRCGAVPRAAGCCAARRLQQRHAEPLCLQARAFAAQPREGLGPLHAAGHSVRLLGAQRSLWHPPAAGPRAAHRSPGQHAGDRLVDQQRRPCGAGRGGARWRSADRRRGRLRAFGRTAARCRRGGAARRCRAAQRQDAV